MRDKCRYCGNERKEGIEWYDENYCSGKCKKLDGGRVLPEIEHAKVTGVKASLEDYLLDYPKKLGEKDGHGQRIKGRSPKRYHRRFEPNRLNWGEPLIPKELKQAGLRANREPILGDFDYTVAVPEPEVAQKPIKPLEAPEGAEVVKEVGNG